MTKVPTQQELMWPVLQAMRDLGGSARNAEISERVADRESYSEELLAVPHKPGSPLSKIDYNLAWARTYLKNIGALTNTARGVWTLTELGRTLTRDEMELLYKGSKETTRRPTTTLPEQPDKADERMVDSSDPNDDPGGTDGWRNDLLEKLMQMSPAAFERLAQLLLREAGFRNVEVLGKSGDGGIDGVGVYRLSLVSFPTYFQCKRYRGSVPAGAVRDFRGAMSGRGDKGLIITTGSFTRGARSEATRDGAPPVDLVSGDELCDLLKEYGLGVTVTKRWIEDIKINPGFFDRF